MSSKVTSLLFKNGFRVFGKTKVLATQLTVLTTLAATSLMTTIMTNYNLNESKKSVLDKGELFDFSIDSNIQNKKPILVEEVKRDSNRFANFNLTAPYQKHLNNIIQSHNFSPTQIIYNGVTYQTLQSTTLWTSEVNENNQKLVYYYVAQPDSTGKSLFKYGNLNDNNLLSLINVPSQILQNIISNTSEIFSFASGNIPKNAGIPYIENQTMPSQNDFDLRNILLDQNNIPCGVSKFGYIQVDGYDINKNVTITHNVVNTSKSNQGDFEQFKNISGHIGKVPLGFNIYLGNQSNYFGDYLSFVSHNHEYFPISEQNTILHNALILASVGESFNQIAHQSSGTILNTKWQPYLVSLDFENIKGPLLFAYKLFFDNPNLEPKENDFYNQLYNQLPSTLNLPKKRLNVSILDDLINLRENQKQYPFLKYFRTLFWVPIYETMTNDDTYKIKESFNLTLNSWYDECQNYFNSIINDSNANYFQWKNEVKSLYDELKQLTYNDANPLQIYENFVQFILNNTYVGLDKQVLLDGLKQERSYFENYKKRDGPILEYWLSKFDVVLKPALLKNLNYNFYSWYTIEGLLSNFGFIYKKSSDFTTQNDINGISYTFSELNRNADVNNVVSSEPINWDFFIPNINLDIEHFKNVGFSLFHFASHYGTIHTKPSQANYDWFVNEKPYQLFKLMAESSIYNGKKSQNEAIIKSCVEMSKLDETIIKNENDFNTIWWPALVKSFDVFIIRSISNNGPILNLNLGYKTGLGFFATVPLDAKIVDKTGLNVLVSQTYLSNNLYDSQNPNGKSVYPYFDTFEKVSKLPYIQTNTESNDFNPSSPNWIFNYDTNQYEFFADYDSWINSLPSKYKMLVNGQELLIVGSALSPEFLYPAQNPNSLLVDPKRSPIMYANNVGFNFIKYQNQVINQSTYYSVRFPNHKNETYMQYLGLFNPFNDFNKILLENVVNTNKNIGYWHNDSSQPNRLLYIRTNFTSNIQNILFVVTLLLTFVLLLLSGVFVCTLIRSIVKQNKKTFGIAISNGINKSKLSLSMLPFALIPGVIAGIFGYLFATLLQPIVLNSISAYWSLPISYNYYIWWLFFLVPIIFVGILYLIIHLVVLWTLRKNVTDLLTSSVSFRMNSLIEHSKWFTRRMRPTNAFKVTYMLGNVTRFLTLIGVITTFITMATTSIGTLGAFTNSLAYTQRNKNYVYGFDLISPTAQGGWYYAMPYSQIGTTQQGIKGMNLNDNDNLTTSYSGTYNQSKLVFLNQLISSEVNLKIWLQTNFASYEYGKPGQIQINNNLVSKFVTNQDVKSLTVNIETYPDSDVLKITPVSVVVKNELTLKNVNILEPQTIYMQYVTTPSIYNQQVYGSAWKDYYSKDLSYTSFFYPSFKIADQFFNDIQFFKDKAFMQSTLDIDFDLGAMQINPWSLAKTLLPTSIIEQATNAQNETMNRLIQFFKYLDLVSQKIIVDDKINYENYYHEMNPSWNLKAYNPVNIDGSYFQLNQAQEVVLSPNKSLIKINEDDGKYVLNQKNTVKGLPTFEMLPQSVFLINLINTNINNSVYCDWLQNVYLKDKKIKEYETNFKLATNVIALTDKVNNQNNFIESTYTYVLGSGYKNNDVNNEQNIKIIGLNSYDLNDKPIEQQSVKLFDKNNNYLNNLLKNKLSNNTYPLIINEVAARIYNLNEGDQLTIHANNYFNRYIDKGNNITNNDQYKLTVVGITTSKSETQMYTNQIFANEMLGYTKPDAIITYQNIKDSFGLPFVPFNGFYTNNPNSPTIKNLAAIYSVSGLTPINSIIKKSGSGDDSGKTIKINADKLNNILKFNIVNGPKDVEKLITKLIDIFGSPNASTLNFVNAAINNVDVSFASQIVGGTIDNTIYNVQTILILALLPTLLIIICLMATMIVTESRRLIAIMKVLGIGDWKNTFNFLFIYFIVLLFGLVLAIPLTYGILALFSYLSFNFFNIIINPVAPWWIYLAIIGILGLIFATMFGVVKNKMGKINLPQAIDFGS